MARAFELQKRLGAESSVSAQRFTIYIPDRDAESQPVENIEDWISIAMDLMAELNGGVTRTEWAQGVCVTASGRQFSERTTLVYSFLEDPPAFEAGFEKVREFVHSFGRETKQDAVMVEHAGESPVGQSYLRAYKVREYDPPIEG